ncbi:MAG: hypothetical protein H7238_05935 [Polaromonas sp.]|nr:hypothetical protein [Polaromonas sp.]
MAMLSSSGVDCANKESAVVRRLPEKIKAFLALASAALRVVGPEAGLIRRSLAFHGTNLFDLDQAPPHRTTGSAVLATP